jgi:hypothetical protein
VFLLNVFPTRLDDVADRFDLPARNSTNFDHQLRRLRLRFRILDVAVFLAALVGMLTCAAALTVFLGTMYHATDNVIRFGIFGRALPRLIFALMAFSVKTILSGRTAREQAERAPNLAPQDQS